MSIKSTLVTPPNKAKITNWNTRQIVEFENCVIATNGVHADRTFEGVILSDDKYDVGTFKQDWLKEMFTPSNTPITITFENE